MNLEFRSFDYSKFSCHPPVCKVDTTFKHVWLTFSCKNSSEKNIYVYAITKKLFIKPEYQQEIINVMLKSIRNLLEIWCSRDVEERRQNRLDSKY